MADGILRAQRSGNRLIEVDAMSEVVKNLLSGVALIGVLFTPRQYENINDVFAVDDMAKIRRDVHVVAQQMKDAVQKVKSEQSNRKAAS